MAKISELSTYELNLYKDKYKAKLEADRSDVDASKKLAAIDTELARRVAEKTGVTETQTLQDSKIIKHHSSEVDHSQAENAEFLQRLFAVIIDTVLITIACNILISIIGVVTPPDIAILSAMIVNLSIPTIYYIGFLYKNEGQTLGKKIIKIRVISEKGSDLTLGQCFMREAIGKFISGVVFMLGFIWVLLGKTAWHDSMADTRVIKVD